jgi:hypothetical protein
MSTVRKPRDAAAPSRDSIDDRLDRVEAQADRLREKVTALQRQEPWQLARSEALRMATRLRQEGEAFEAQDLEDLVEQLDAYIAGDTIRVHEISAERAQQRSVRLDQVERENRLLRAGISMIQAIVAETDK